MNISHHPAFIIIASVPVFLLLYNLTNFLNTLINGDNPGN